MEIEEKMGKRNGVAATNTNRQTLSLLLIVLPHLLSSLLIV